MKYSEAKQAIEEIGKEELRDLIERYSEDAVQAALECGVNLSDFEEVYQGEYSSDEDFAREMADQLGSIDKNASWPQTCIDWEHAAKELMYDYSEHNGHYFRSL